MSRKENNNKLAIVIPAYKACFLRQTLDSISRQTGKCFKVYIGDDASPDDLKEICDEFAPKLDLVYTRFDKNLGGSSLVGHWNRCIEMSSEPWVWLFCDDDIMGPECVEMFHKTIEREKDKYRVLRFNTLIIDDKDEVIRINPPHPLTETVAQFIYHRLQYERSSYVSEYIFSRESYLENKGMIDFPMAWCSDDASWVAFPNKNGIFTIPGPYVRWRQSSQNISPSGAKYQTDRIEASFRFVNWLDNFIKINGTGNQYVTRDMIKNLSKSWFLRHIRIVAPIRLSNFSKFSRCIRSVTDKGWLLSYTYLLKSNLIFYLNKLNK